MAWRKEEEEEDCFALSLALSLSPRFYGDRAAHDHCHVGEGMLPIGEEEGEQKKSKNREKGRGRRKICLRTTVPACASVPSPPGLCMACRRRTVVIHTVSAGSIIRAYMHTKQNS